MSERDPLLVLGGTALRVYLTLVRLGRPVGVRELQRIMGFSSPSTALHHLRRLESLGLVEKRSEGYVARRPSGLLSLFVSIGGRLVPVSLLGAAGFTGALIGYLASGASGPLGVALLAACVAYNWLIGLYLYRSVARLLGEHHGG